MIFFFLFSLLFAQEIPPTDIDNEKTEQIDKVESKETNSTVDISKPITLEEDFDFDEFEKELGLEQNLSEEDHSEEIVVYYIFTPMYWIADNFVEFIIGITLLVFMIMAAKDFVQRSNALKRNFPLMAMGRYFLASVGPPLRQYLFANDKEERPIPRFVRNWIYASSQNKDATVPFGTQLDIHKPGSVMMRHSAYPKLEYRKPNKMDRILVGKNNPHCELPYNVAMFNTSAMSFGSLGKNAVQALNIGAKEESYYQNTGEGGVAQYHLKNNGDLVWQLGTGKFGAREKDADAQGQPIFSEKLYIETVSHPNIKMTELKLSQGAKPGKGGILPAEKNTSEIAKIRNVTPGEDVLSPARHKEWNDASGMLKFIENLQKLSKKPVGIKFCLGDPNFLDELCQAIKTHNIFPDYIAVDGAEGGTGAAPMAHTNMLGYPMLDAVMLTENKLIEYGLREKIPIAASGKIFTGGDLAIALAAGADWACSARGFMLSIGCIQALHCNTNFCPSGVATHSKWLQRGLVPSVQGDRAGNYQHAVMKEFSMILASCGYSSPTELSRKDIMKVIDWHKLQTLDALVPYPKVAPKT
jgi:glutamate synthase domain-containing protein 2